MIENDLVTRLRRYTENCVAYKLDADFAAAVQEAADAIEDLATNYEASTDIMKHQTEYIEELERERDSANEAATALYGALPRWIPVEERLPENGYRVLISNGKGFVCVAYLAQSKRWKRHGCYVDYMQPTHWMPLPEAPDGE